MGIPLPGTGSVTEDQNVQGGNLTASGDVNYLGGSDAGQWTPGTFAGSYGSLSIDSNGAWTYTANNAQPAIQALNTGDTLQEVFNVTSARGSTTVTITINGADEPPCFTRGTLIETPHGPRRIEDLRPGDAVLTRDAGVQRITWIGSRSVDMRGAAPDAPLRPIRLRAGSIAPGVPDRDMLVSPMHRILYDGPEAALFFGQDEVLVAARLLVNDETILRDQTPSVDYFHLLFDAHQVVSSHGLMSESFYPGGVGLTAFVAEQREEVFALFPELRSLPGRYGPTARNVLKRYEAQVVNRALAPLPDVPFIVSRSAA